MTPIENAIARMAGHRVYIDTNVFIYFLAHEGAMHQVVAPIMQACASRTIFGFTGELVIAEVMVHPYRSGDASLIARFKSFFRQKNFLSIADHEPRFFDEAAMIAGQQRLKLMDAIHYRTAIEAGCRFFVTHDKDFNAIESTASMEVIRLTDLAKQI